MRTSENPTFWDVHEKGHAKEEPVYKEHRPFAFVPERYT
jgi:hypothetical protein